MQTHKENIEDDRVKIEKPQKYTAWNVMYWEPESKRLLELKKNGDKVAGTLLSKAKKFVDEGCIKFSGQAGQNKRWYCEPIKGYNKTTYTILFNGENWDCNCQGFDNNDNCSHIVAVKQWEFING